MKVKLHHFCNGTWSSFKTQNELNCGYSNYDHNYGVFTIQKQYSVDYNPFTCKTSLYYTWAEEKITCKSLLAYHRP